VILVTGGAGYVGRNVCRAIGKGVVAVDDLRNSWRAALPDGIPLHERDLSAVHLDTARYDAVVHCAGSMDVAESVAHPAMYWWNNVAVAAAFFPPFAGKRVVFSSTCQVYGEPASSPVSENSPASPINPYGQSKLAAEGMLRDLGVQLTVLRYFNAAGGDQVHKKETHLIPRILRAALTGEPVVVYGDGSAVRDYVHVEDVARAHLAALEKEGVYNLGSGRGSTVLEVIETARRVTGRRIEVTFADLRPGDPKGLVADISKARRELGWEPKHGLGEIVASAWAWRLANPEGYGDGSK
jgi:UDP-glucose 4-epimerase